MGIKKKSNTCKNLKAACHSFSPPPTHLLEENKVPRIAHDLDLHRNVHHDKTETWSIPL